MPGPPREPTEILKLRGSRLPKRQKRPNRGNFARDTDALTSYSPSHLDEEQRKLWRYLARYLKKAGIGLGVDKLILERYCITRGRWLAIMRELDVEVKTADADDAARDKSQKHQAAIALTADKLAAQLTILEDRMGLNPKSRSAIKSLPKPITPDIREKFFAQSTTG